MLSEVTDSKVKLYPYVKFSALLQSGVKNGGPYLEKRKLSFEKPRNWPARSNPMASNNLNNFQGSNFSGI